MYYGCTIPRHEILFCDVSCGVAIEDAKIPHLVPVDKAREMEVKANEDSGKERKRTI
jgi:hypothetical protein